MVLNEKEVIARVGVGFDSPDVETVTRSIGTRSPGLDTAGRPRTAPDIEAPPGSAATKAPELGSGGKPQPIRGIEVVPRHVSMRPSGIDTVARSQTDPPITPSAAGAGSGGAETAGDHPGGGDTGSEYSGTAAREPGVPDKSGLTDTSSEPHISRGNGPERAFDVTADKVFTSVIERIEATGIERNRAIFEIETDQGQRIRVRLTVDHNMVSARIDAPNEQVRDLLAGNAWELNQRLETEGLIPNDIEFGLTGGRQQAANHDGRPGIHNAIENTSPEEDIENFTMVESEAYAFESWA